MAIRFYRAVLIDSGDTVSVAFPDLPGCISQGDNIQDAANMGREALSLHVEGMLRDGEALPEPSELGAPLPDWLAEDITAEGASYRETLLPVEVERKPMRLTISLPADLVASVDRAAERHGFTRSGYLAQAARDKMQREQEAA